MYLIKKKKFDCKIKFARVWFINILFVSIIKHFLSFLDDCKSLWCVRACVCITLGSVYRISLNVLWIDRQNRLGVGPCVYSVCVCCSISDRLYIFLLICHLLVFLSSVLHVCFHLCLSLMPFSSRFSHFFSLYCLPDPLWLCLKSWPLRSTWILDLSVT